MRFKNWMFCIVSIVALLLLRVKGQEKIDLLAEKNEIPYEKDDHSKMIKSSSKPIMIIKQSQYEETSSITAPSMIETTSPKLNKYSTTSRRPNPPSLICPSKDVSKPFFALPCFATANCGLFGKDMLCCDGRCLKGVKPPKADPDHDPIFFGLIHRKCPADPLTELSEVKECLTDEECSPRICCGETLPSGERIRYCRTPIPVWDSLPLPSPVLEPLKVMTSYMQCTPPPPPHLDLYPKTCQNPMDCFPNLCCQEKGKKYCRPPKRSLLALVAELGQRIIPEDTAKKFIERIS